MEAFAPAFALAVLLAFVGYRQWLRHQQRVLIHKERLAALEKGADLPAWPESARPFLGVRQILLLSGLIWLALGIGGMLAAFSIVSKIQHIQDAPPANIGLIGVPVALIGVAHLIVYALHRRD